MNHFSSELIERGEKTLFEVLVSNNNMKEQVTEISKFCQKATGYDSLLIELKAHLTVSQPGLGLDFKSSHSVGNVNLEVFAYISQSEMIILGVTNDIPAGMTSLDFSIENHIKQELKIANINMAADFNVKSFHIMTGKIHRNQLQIAQKSLAHHQFKMRNAAADTGLKFHGTVFVADNEIMETGETLWPSFECNRYILNKAIYLAPMIQTNQNNYNTLLSEKLLKGEFSYMETSDIIKSIFDAKIFYKAAISRFQFKIYCVSATYISVF